MYYTIYLEWVLSSNLLRTRINSKTIAIIKCYELSVQKKQFCKANSQKR